MALHHTLEPISGNAVIGVENNGGNSALSDLVATVGGKETLVEVKFGALTNAASGIGRISRVFNYDAFMVTREEK